MWRGLVPIVYLFVMILTAGCGGGGSSAHIAARFSEGSAGFYHSPPSIRDDAIYIGTSRKYADAPATDNFFFKLTLNLEEIWRYELGTTEVRGAAAVDASGRAFFVTGAGRAASDDSNLALALVALDTDGTLLWIKPLTIADAGITMHCLQASDGTLLWSVAPASAQGEFRATPAVDAEGNAYVGTKADADITWSSAAIGTGGGIFIGTMDNPDAGLGGTLFRFAGEATGFLPNAGSPRFHEGNASTGRRGE